jgi:hypothetical protein
MSRFPIVPEDKLGQLYTWIDSIPLSRTKRNINRDFSDGCLLAEVIAFYFPRLVELHNYSQANSLDSKRYNFRTMNKKVLSRFDRFQISPLDIEDVVHCRDGAIERVLYALQFAMADMKEKIAKKHGKQLVHGRRGGLEQNGKRGIMHAGSFDAPRSSTSSEGPEHANEESVRQVVQEALQQHHPSPLSPSSSSSSSSFSNIYQETHLPSSYAHRHKPQSEDPFLEPNPLYSQEEEDDDDDDDDEEVTSHPVTMEKTHRDLLVEYRREIEQLRESVELLSLKNTKLEQLVRVKDTKIARLMREREELKAAVINSSGGPGDVQNAH